MFRSVPLQAPSVVKIAPDSGAPAKSGIAETASVSVNTANKRRHHERLDDICVLLFSPDQGRCLCASLSARGALGLSSFRDCVCAPDTFTTKDRGDDSGFAAYVG